MPDDRIETLSKWRGILGIACTLYFTLSYRSPLEMVADAVDGLILLVLISMVVVGIATAALFLATPPW